MKSSPPFTVTFKTPPKFARATQVALIDEFDAALADGNARVERIPPASATTAVRAIRFSRDVFVDIDFLSLVVDETFPPTAGKD
jgi:hypothetical protein